MSMQVMNGVVKEVSLELPLEFDFYNYNDRTRKHGYDIEISLSTKKFNDKFYYLDGIVDIDARKLIVTGFNMNELHDSDWAGIYKDLFKKFKGTLIATFVWEGGNIEKIDIRDGIDGSKMLKLEDI